MLSNNTVLLNYSLATDPDPLQVSPASGDPQYGRLTIIVSNNTMHKIYCNQIVFSFPVGKIAQDLTPNASTAKAVQPPSGAWTFVNNTDGSFTAAPTNPNNNAVTTDGLVFVIDSIQVNQSIGNFLLTVMETASTDNSFFGSNATIFNLGKFPYGFYANNFTVDVPQINSGETVTLTWNGSNNAVYTLSYADQHVNVTEVRTWTSPPLYSTTAFVLQASVSQTGQTVSLYLNTIVVIASPDVQTFDASPSEIDYNQTVVLNWRAINADGVYLLTGETGKETLAATSDPNHPKTIQPQFGVIYSLQAFKNQSGGQILSKSYPLGVTFNQMLIKSFKATPPVVDVNHPTTTLTWEVDHAKSVALQGNAVPAKGSQPQTPQDDSVYTLAATWVDGSVMTQPLTVPVLRVRVHGVAPQFHFNATTANLTFIFTVDNATGGTASAHLMFCDRVHWHIWGHPYQSPDVSGNAVRIKDNTWQVDLTFQNLPANVLGYPNVGVGLSYTFEGLEPVSSGGNILMYRGNFSFWNGS